MVLSERFHNTRCASGSAVVEYNLNLNAMRRERTVIEIRKGKACQIIRKWKSFVSDRGMAPSVSFVDFLTKGQKFEF